MGRKLLFPIAAAAALSAYGASGKESIAHSAVSSVQSSLSPSAFTAFVADNQQGVGTACAVVGALLLVSGVIDVSLVLRMFLPLGRRTSALPSKGAVSPNGAPASPSAPASSLHGFRWDLFRWMNWISSISFLLSLTHLAANTRRGHSVLFHSKFAVVVCLLSLAYLLLFFGVSLIQDDIRESLEAAGELPPQEANSPPRAPGSPTSKSSKSRSPIAVVICTVAVLIPIGVMIIGTYYGAPTFASFLYSSFFPALFSLATAENTPWAVACAAIFVMFLRERSAKRAAELDAATQRRDELDRERSNTYPISYPNGWYPLMASSDLKPGDVKHVDAIGQQFAVYRGENDGKVHVLDAYCPHLGANLAVGGKVKGDCIECPFHQWQFNGDGSVASIPYSDARPPKAQQAHSWPSMEYYGTVVVYVDAERRQPPYLPPSITDIDTGKMVWRGRHTARNVRMNLMEFCENSVDFAHFQPLHGDMMIPWTPYSIPFVKIQHTADWVLGTEEEGKHIAHFKDHAVLKVFGKLLPSTEANADITFVGPAGLVFFRITIDGVGDIVMFQNHTPLSPILLKTEFNWFADSSVPRLLVSYVVGNWVSQWANDLLMWENKVHLRRPLLVRGDGPFNKLRRWYAQFYSTGKPAIEVDSGAVSDHTTDAENLTESPCPSKAARGLEIPPTAATAAGGAGCAAALGATDW